MKWTWHAYQILFCKWVDSADCLKKILASLNTIKEIFCAARFCYSTFNDWTKLKNKVFLTLNIPWAKIIRITIFVDPNFANSSFIKFYHAGVDMKTPKMITQSLKANQWLFHDVHTLYERYDLKIFERF